MNGLRALGPQREETISQGRPRLASAGGDGGVVVAGSTPLSSQVLGFRSYRWETPVWPVFALGGHPDDTGVYLIVMHLWENSVVQMYNRKVVTRQEVWSWSVLSDRPISLPRKPPF